MPDREIVIESLNKALTRVGYGDMDNVTLSEVEEAIESAIALLREQAEIIDRYRKADTFLYAHGWKWDCASD